MEDLNTVDEAKSIYKQLNQHLDLKIKGNPFKQYKEQ